MFTFKAKTFKEYMLIYYKSDVLILADVIQNFIDACLKTHQLPSACYFTLSSMNWSAMLTTISVQLDTLTDYNMIMMIKKRIFLEVVSYSIVISMTIHI